MSTNNKFEILKTILVSLEDGITEIMCHPGYFNDQPLSNNTRNLLRQQELEALVQPKLRKIIIENQINLITYRDIESS